MASNNRVNVVKLLNIAELFERHIKTPIYSEEGGGDVEQYYITLLDISAANIRKAVENAYEPDAKREAAAEWVEEQGGIEEATYIVEMGKEYNHQLEEIIEYLGACSRKKLVLSSQDRYERIMSELHKRLMPEGMEWPRFEDGERVEFGSAVDGLDGPCEKFIFTRSMGGVCQLQDANGNMVNVIHGERVKRPEPEVLAADGLPIKVGETVYGTGREQDVYKVTSMDKSKAQGRFAVECIGNGGETCMVDPSQLTHTPPDTQERLDAEIISDYRDSICPQLEPYTREYCTNKCYCDSCLAERIMEQCDRQRELCAKGGE